MPPHEQIEYLERITTGLHESVMKVRMVPIESVVAGTCFAAGIIQKECLLKAARAFLVFKAVEDYGNIIAYNPSSQDIEDEKFGNDFILRKFHIQIFFRIFFIPWLFCGNFFLFWLFLFYSDSCS